MCRIVPLRIYQGMMHLVASINYHSYSPMLQLSSVIAESDVRKVSFIFWFHQSIF